MAVHGVGKKKLGTLDKKVIAISQMLFLKNKRSKKYKHETWVDQHTEIFNRIVTDKMPLKDVEELYSQWLITGGAGKWSVPKEKMPKEKGVKNVEN